MFSINGTLKNTFVQAGGKGKDGKPYPDTFKAQIEGKATLKNGETRLELVTLTVPEVLISEIKDQVGSDVMLPCGIFAKNNQVIPFLLGR